MTIGAFHRTIGSQARLGVFRGAAHAGDWIRLALGEMPGQVLRGILSETGWLVGVGLAAGIPTSMLAARVAVSLLYGVSPKDVWSQMTAAGVLAAVGLAASFIPAYHASRINPLEALRYE